MLTVLHLHDDNLDHEYNPFLTVVVDGEVPEDLAKQLKTELQRLINRDGLEYDDVRKELYDLLKKNYEFIDFRIKNIHLEFR